MEHAAHTAQGDVSPTSKVVKRQARFVFRIKGTCLPCPARSGRRARSPAQDM